MQGKKTHEQQIRNIERKGDVPKPHEDGATPDRPEHAATHPDARASDMPVSRGGMNQESDHNKHNDPGQSGHKPQKPGPNQEKQD